MKRNKNDKLIEDAAIRLAANAYVEKEGEKIIEEAKRLNQEKKVSSEQLAEFERFCSKEFAKQEWKSKLKQVSKVAVAAVAVVVFVSGIYQYNMTYNPVVKKGTTANGKSSKDYTGDERLKFVPTYIPERFIEKKVTYISDKVIKIKYLAEEKVFFAFYYKSKESQTNKTSDDDNADYIDIDGSRAKVTHKPSENIVTVTWEKGEHIFCVEAQGVDKEEVIKVAKSVKSVNGN